MFNSLSSYLSRRNRTPGFTAAAKPHENFHVAIFSQSQLPPVPWNLRNDCTAAANHKRSLTSPCKACPSCLLFRGSRVPDFTAVAKPKKKSHVAIFSQSYFTSVRSQISDSTAAANQKRSLTSPCLASPSCLLHREKSRIPTPRDRPPGPSIVGRTLSSGSSLFRPTRNCHTP